jgi:hypothetical protein
MDSIFILRSSRSSGSAAIRAFVLNVIVTHPLAPADNLVLYRLLGAVFHRQAQAERLCAAFETELRKTLVESKEFHSSGDCSGKRVAFVDGTMTGWYGSRAIEGLRYLRELARKLSRES